MKFVNLTPHVVNLQREDGTIEDIHPSGECRVAITDIVMENINGIPIVRAEYGDLIGLPECESGTIYIVSLLAAQAAARIGRVVDIVSPGKLLRHPKGHELEGQPYACTTLTRQA